VTQTNSRACPWLERGFPRSFRRANHAHGTDAGKCHQSSTPSMSRLSPAPIWGGKLSKLPRLTIVEAGRETLDDDPEPSPCCMHAFGAWPRMPHCRHTVGTRDLRSSHETPLITESTQPAACVYMLRALAITTLMRSVINNRTSSATNRAPASSTRLRI